MRLKHKSSEYNSNLSKNLQRKANLIAKEYKQFAQIPGRCSAV